MSEDIIVVSGVPRSGTSLVMNMLEAAGVEILADDVRPPDASNPRGYFELEAVKRTHRDPSWVELAPGKAVKVIHGLLPALPRDHSYRVLLMERSLAEVVASQSRMLAELGHVGRVDVSDERLEQLFAAQLTATRALLDHEPCFAWMPVAFSDLLEQPLTMAERILRHVGIDGSAEAMAARVDPRLYRSRITE
jgi:hypothetical protein